MDDDEWLTNAEDQLLGDLEESPLPLWKIRGGHVTTERLETFLVPGLTSLAARGLIEVRRFNGWPTPWDRGSPVVGEDLLQESRRLDAWSAGATPVMAAHITPEGAKCLWASHVGHRRAADSRQRFAQGRQARARSGKCAHVTL